MNQPDGLRKIRRALISVSDKARIVEFAQTLVQLDVEILSTGGTGGHLRAAGISIRDVSDVTEFPEMMDGRVKTLHPRIHGGLLALRDNDAHIASMKEHGIEPIDLVVINLYPFEATIRAEGVSLEEAIEQIDIGGPAMIRSSAKNWRDVAVVVSPAMYGLVINELKQHGGALSLATRAQLAKSAFALTSRYDTAIFSYLSEHIPPATQIPELQAFGTTYLEAGMAFANAMQQFAGPARKADEPEPSPFALVPDLFLAKIRDLRYGENPHQEAALYELRDQERGVAQAELLSGKEMSYNNYIDADAAWQLVCDFDQNTCAIIKHTNPAGVAQAATSEEAYRKALATDPLSAFGGIVAFNRKVDEAAAKSVIEIFTEVVIAPSFSDSALDVLKTKKNLRVLRVGEASVLGEVQYRQISGGMLAQTPDTHRLNRDNLKIVSKRQPSAAEIDALLFAWTVCKHTKSNAIVYARAAQTIGVGAGQMSRVDSVKLGAMRAQLPVEKSVLASDAFFPFRDGIDEAAKHGITAVIQPGGSVKDAEVIAAADEHDLAMVFTGVRHFKH